MSFYPDSSNVTLSSLQKRLEETDLVPSRISLLNNIRDNFNKLKAAGLLSLADLRRELKNIKNISSFSKKCGIDTEYLTLLRREIEGYFPKSLPLSDFDWLPKKELAKLEKEGFVNSASLYEVVESTKKRVEISKSLGIELQFIEQLYSLINLTRIQWVSPVFARLLVAAGYDNAKKVSEAEAEQLYVAIDKVNKENQFFKGKIGLRDIKRLVSASCYA